MNVEVKIPDAVGDENTRVKIVQWLCRTGQHVEEGQGLLEAETDKAVMEIESPATGVLDEILVQDGDEVSVGQIVAIIQSEDTSSQGS